MRVSVILAFELALLCATSRPSLASQEQSQASDRQGQFQQLVKRANEEFAASHFEEAKKIYEEAVAEGKKASVNKPDIAVVMSDIALIDKLTFHLEEAQDCLMDALPLAGDDQALRALLELRLSSVMRARGNLYGALDKAIDSADRRRKVDAKNPLLAESLNNAAVLSLELKNNKQALDYCNQALEVLKESGQEGSVQESAVLSTKAACLSEDGDYDGARLLLVQVLAGQEKCFGAESPKLSSTLNNLAMTYSKQKRYQEAEPYLVRALKLAETSMPRDVAGAADACANLADLYARMGERARADLNFKKAIEYCQSINYRHLKDIKSQYQSFLAGEIPASDVLQTAPLQTKDFSGQAK